MASANGIPEFTPSFMGGRGGTDSPLGPIMDMKFTTPPPNMLPPDAEFHDKFAAMALGHQRSNFSPIKGPNPNASEFVPKTLGNSVGLTHSASSPSFSTYSHLHAGLVHSSIGTPPVFSTGASPMGSPGLSPQGSPILQRTKSPALRLAGNSTPTSSAAHQENIGGTTFFYTQEELSSQVPGIVMPNFTMYPSIMPHVGHMKLKANMPSFFMPDEIKLELLNRHTATLAQIDPEQNPDIPQEVDNYHCLFPLEPTSASPLQQKSGIFGYPTTCYKAMNSKDAMPYCLRRIHGFRLSNTKCMTVIDLWKKMQHSNIVQLREVFTTKAFGDHSMVFVYDFHPRSDTLMSRHFSNPSQNMNGYSSPYNLDGAARPFSAGKGANGPRQHAGLLPESLIWSYVVQLTSALRTIHAHGLACRVMDPTKILLTDKSRIRLNCLGIFDVLGFDASQSNPLAMMSHHQQEDLVALGKVVLALACNSVVGIQQEHLRTSMELVTRNYSADLKNLILYLLTKQNRMRSVNDIMPMIGARFYTQLDANQLKNDALENELAKEVENGRLFRLICKLGILNERPEFNMDTMWSETGDRYMLKLFRDYLFHQVDENGAPWIDMAHVVQCLNKLDAGVPEKVVLMSRDEQSVLVVTYAELKQCFESAFNELLQASQASQAQSYS